MMETMGKPDKSLDETVKHICDSVQKRIYEAYQRGLEEGKKAFDLLDAERDSEYQRGLDDAWEAARRISVIDLSGGLTGDEMMKIYGTMELHKIYDDNTASEAIEKLKAYEERQKAYEEIKVGDEVDWNGDSHIVTYINIDIDTSEVKDYDLMMFDGSVVDHVKKYNFVKTGRHFDIDKILEEMKK